MAEASGAVVGAGLIALLDCIGLTIHARQTPRHAGRTLSNG
ncbi:hypothetical protein ACO2Q2_01605 [Dyella sp. KRB-257]